MVFSTRLRRLVAGALVATLVAIGAIGATHAHAATEKAGDHCATCRVVHSAAIAPAPLVPLASALVVERVHVPAPRQVLSPGVACVLARGPPSSLQS